MKHVTKGKGMTGFGGIKCACCTKGLPKDVKRETSRWKRRNSKKEIKKMLA